MKLSISNFAWAPKYDDMVYEKMKELGYEGLEMAAIRSFPNNPYDQTDGAKKFAEDVRKKGFSIVSMQSILSGRKENIFGTDKEREVLLSYLRKGVDFAEIMQCKNLVFGCPANRRLDEPEKKELAEEFFREIGNYAWKKGRVIAMEAAPGLYGTNYVNHTTEAFRLVAKVNSPGFLVNLDFGTMMYDYDSPDILEKYGHLIHHVHISQAGLGVVDIGKEHVAFAKKLKEIHYDNYVSLEIGRQENPELIFPAMERMMEVFA